MMGGHGVNLHPIKGRDKEALGMEALVTTLLSNRVSRHACAHL